MKKISFLSAVLVVSGSVSAHQVSGEFHDKSWNWNNGSHFLSKVMGNEGVSSVSKKVHKHTEVEEIVKKPMSDQPMKDAYKTEEADKIPAVKDAYKTEEIDKVPMYDTGVRPSNSK